MNVSTIESNGNSDSWYVDLYVYISPDNVCEYRFGVSLDRENGNIFDGGVAYAAHSDEALEEINIIPEDVQCAFDSVRPKMVDQLKSEALLPTASIGATY